MTDALADPGAVSPVGGVARFYWAWLVFATGVSVLGNVTHALLVAPEALRLLAAVASIVPPSFVLGSTHSVGIGLRMRRWALVHVSGLMMTVCVAACAFFLSFDALRGLAVMLGWPSRTAWLFPVTIDVSIAQATFGLLSLRADQPRRPAHQWAAEPDSGPARGTSAAGARAQRRRADASARVGAVSDKRPPDPTATQDHAIADAESSVAYQEDSADLTPWRDAADELVRKGTTSKNADVVAMVLALHASGTALGTISRRLKVHHSTVARILVGSASLAASSPGRLVERTHPISPVPQ